MSHVSKLCLISAVLVLAACGEPTPAPSTAPESPAAAPESPAVPAPSDTSGAIAAYEGDVATLPAGGHCALDAVNGAPVDAGSFAVGDEVVFGGWMAAADGTVPTDARLVLASAAGSYAVPVAGGVERADVAAALEQPGLAMSGFNAQVTLDVAPGSYQAYIVHGGTAPAACQLQGTLAVGE